MLSIIIPTILATLAFGYWFRASNTRARYLPDFAYSGRLELVTWSIPLLTITLLGGVAWISSHELDPRREDRLHRPADRDPGCFARLEVAVHISGPARCHRQSAGGAGGRADPFLADLGQRHERLLRRPSLAAMIYTMNGMATQLNLQADQPGHLPRAVIRPLQRRWIRRHALRTCMRSAPRTSSQGWVQPIRASAGNTLDDAQLCRPGQAEQEPPRPIRLPRRGGRAVPARSSHNRVCHLDLGRIPVKPEPRTVSSPGRQ